MCRVGVTPDILFCNHGSASSPASDGIDPHKVAVKRVVYRGADLTNDTIEIDVAGKPRVGASGDARGFHLHPAHGGERRKR